MNTNLYVTISGEVAKYNLVAIVRMGELIGVGVLETVEERYDHIRSKYLAFKVSPSVNYADLCWIGESGLFRLEMLEPLAVDADGKPAGYDLPSSRDEDEEDDEDEEQGFRW